MKYFTIFTCLLFSFGFTHPFAQDGAVENDSTLMKIRQEEVRRLQKQEQRQEQISEDDILKELKEVDPNIENDASKRDLPRAPR